jgi:quercetin dioxygenase-like cupin family protein
MPHAGQEIVGRDGFRLLLVRTDRDLLEMEATYGGTGQFPPEHMHPNQEERFEVLSGSIRAIVGGEERTYGVGERFDVPVGTPHQMTADEPSRVRWEVRPALRTAEFFERLFGEGPGSAQAAPEQFFAEFSEEIRLTG